MKNNFLFCILTLFTIYFTFNVSSVNAQQISLSFSPPIVETIIKPGKSIISAYTLKNFGDPVIVKIKVLPFTAKDDLGHVNIKPDFEGPVRFSLDNSNIDLNEPFFLKSKDSQQLVLRIRIPEGAPEGDYYYTLLAETQPPPALEGFTNSSAKATIGTNILITVTKTGSLDIDGKISLFDVLSRWKIGSSAYGLRLFDSNDKIPVVLFLSNSGKNMLKPQGEIILQGNFGEKAVYDIISQNVLSQSQRLLLATPSANIALKPQTPTSLILDGFFIGRYRLQTNLSMGDDMKIISATTSFLAFPFKISLGVLAAIIIGIILIKRNK